MPLRCTAARSLPLGVWKHEMGSQTLMGTRQAQLSFEIHSSKYLYVKISWNNNTVIAIPFSNLFTDSALQLLCIIVCIYTLHVQTLIGFRLHYNHKNACKQQYKAHDVCPVLTNWKSNIRFPSLFTNWQHSYHLTYLSADVFGLLWKLVRVLLKVLAHSSVHLFPLDALLALAEGRLALYHLEDQAAQPPPIWAESVALVLDHLRS